ncbi:MAG: type II CAAX endopeptidase family protein [Verrucomicrobiota bacterium]|nr:type II CAAX endopeptidase family protein [Verrucomicrobiota bacterium]
MKTIKKLFIYILFIFIIGSFLAPILYFSLQQLGLFIDCPFRRIANRAFMLVAFIGLWPFLKSLNITGRKDWGFNERRKDFGTSVLKGLLFGLFSLIIIVALEILIGCLFYMPYNKGITNFILLSISGLISGITIALIEESFFRGILFSAIKKDKGLVFTIFFTSLLYATAHFIGGDIKIPPEQVNFLSGFRVLLNSISFSKSSENITGAFCCLTMIGIFFGMIRHYRGSISLQIGIHTGWVMAIKVARKISDVNTNSPFDFLICGYDDITGFLAFYCVAAMAICYLKIYAGKITKTQQEKINNKPQLFNESHTEN